MHIKATNKELALINLKLRAFMSKMYLEISEKRAIVQKHFIAGDTSKEHGKTYFVEILDGDNCTIEDVDNIGERVPLTFSELVLKFENDELNYVSNDLDDDEEFLELFLETFASGYLWHIQGLPTFEDKLEHFAYILNIKKSDIFMDDFTWVYGKDEDKHKKLQLQMLVDVVNQVLPYKLELKYRESSDKYFIVDDDGSTGSYAHLATIIYETLLTILSVDSRWWYE